MTAAPDFPGSDYPSGGALIGPAWADAWAVLAAGPVAYPRLREHLLARHPIAEKTLVTLLAQARSHGYVATTGQRRWDQRTVSLGPGAP